MPPALGRGRNFGIAVSSPQKQIKITGWWRFGNILVSKTSCLITLTVMKKFGPFYDSVNGPKTQYVQHKQMLNGVPGDAKNKKRPCTGVESGLTM